MSLLKEAPRSSKVIPRLLRLQYADMDTRGQIEEFKLGVPDHAHKAGRSALPELETIEVFSASFKLQERVTVVRAGDIAKKRAVVISDLLSHPAEPATPAWRKFMVRNFERIRNFAKTAKNKGETLDSEFLK